MSTTLSTPFIPSTVQTKPFAGQKPGTSGLRKRVPEFQQPNYTENFVQCVLDGGLGEAKRGAVLVVGGDGSFLCPQAVNLVIKIAAANGVSKLIIGRDGFLSTPAVSHLIRKGDNGRKINGGIILTASHNRGGTINDFGIKFNCENGGPAPDSVTERIYQLSTNIAEFRICLNLDIDFGQIGTTMATIEGVGQFVVQVIDSVQDYADYLEKIFDFPKIRSLLTGGMANGRPFRLLVDSMHGVTGPYVSTIFVDRLGAPAQSCLRTVLKPDFGGDHPDPNLTYAKGLVDQMALGEHDIGAAFDVDGDLYMIFGRNAFVKSSDSLAVIAANLDCIPYFKNKTTIGDARSMPTACAVDRAVKVRGRPYLDRAAKLRGRQLPLCGEESFGTGLDRIRETDVLWALLAWLQVLAHKNGTKSVEQLVDEHRCAKSCGVSLMVNEEEQVTFPQRKINRDGYIKAQFFLSSPSSESPSPSPKRKKDKTYKPPSGGRRCKKLADEVVDDSLDQMGLMEQMEVERAGSGLEDGSVGPEGWEAQMAAVLEEDSIIVQQMGSKNDSDLVNFVMENFTAALEEQQNDNAQHEEKSVLDRCNGIMGYLAAIPMLINRLRDAAVFLFYSVSHTSVLLGRHAKTVTCGLHRAERSTLTAQHTNFTEADFYIALQEVNLLTDQQMWDNGYPRWAETSAAAADEAMDDEQGQGLDTDDPPRDGKRRVEIRQSELDAGKSRIPFVDDSVLSRVCDRCGKEYRLTNEGDYAAGASSDQCIFHWGRAWKKRVFGTVESRYNCCDQPLTVQGCDVAPHHITQTQRLSTLRCYAETPRPFGVGDPRSKKVYALDCEMVYTVWGPEVARFSVVDITGDLILDLIIRPEHRIVDCNTKFSGLKPEQVMAGECDLNEAHQRFFELVNTETILLGHSLESDLHAMHLIHRRVVDTSVVFPHRMGPPYKRALKTLAAELTQMIIQDDESGHDSKEDALACMRIMLRKCRCAMSKERRKLISNYGKLEISESVGPKKS